MRVSALLFDLDGTLADSDPLHLEAFQAVLGPDRPLSSETYRREIMGRTNPAIFAELFPDRPQDQAALADEKEARFRALIPALKPVAGAGALLDWAGRAGVPAAVVTNAPRANAVAMLSALGLTDRFETLVIGPECARQKPDPLPYLTAMARLGAAPETCLAFEDSRSGARAAVAAGALTFGLRTSLCDADLRAVGVTATLQDFNDPVLWTFLDNF